VLAVIQDVEKRRGDCGLAADQKSTDADDADLSWLAGA
jgi:hypothetical protein